MNKSDIEANLPNLLPLAIAWAEEQEAQALERGRALGPSGISLAETVGVNQAAKVRVVVTAMLPRPEHPSLREAAQVLGMLGPDTVGLTLGHAVFLIAGQEEDHRLLSHELRHVHQYERHGSIAQFLEIY